MTTVNMREASAPGVRAPRETCNDAVELGLLLATDPPPLALGSNEVETIVGKPPRDFNDPNDGGIRGFDGLRYFRRDRELVYDRGDGTVLTYEYEGALAYRLVEIERSGDA